MRLEEPNHNVRFLIEITGAASLGTDLVGRSHLATGTKGNRLVAILDADLVTLRVFCGVLELNRLLGILACTTWVTGALAVRLVFSFDDLLLLKSSDLLLASFVGVLCDPITSVSIVIEIFLAFANSGCRESGAERRFVTSGRSQGGCGGTASDAGGVTDQRTDEENGSVVQVIELVASSVGVGFSDPVTGFHFSIGDTERLFVGTINAWCRTWFITGWQVDE